jgi:DNA-binding XRE family transcriptional regulator
MTEPEFWHKYAHRIRQQRRLHKFSQRHLGELVGVHRNTIDRWERGLTKIDLWHATKVKEVLGDHAPVEAVKVAQDGI